MNDNTEQLLELVAGLSTADELRDFAKETLGMRVAHNAGEDAIREKIMAHINAGGDPESAPDETDTSHDAPAAASTGEAKHEAPNPDDEAPKPRLLKNTKNGRTFGYTKALAKLKHMEEV